MASADEKSAVHNVPIRVEWKCTADDELKRLGDSDRATLDFGLYQSRREAYFKLRVPVALKGRGKKTNFYLLVHPERFHGLDLDGQPEAISPSIRASFVRTGECTAPEALVALRISLTEPGVLVGPPPSPPLVPKSKKSGDTLALLKSLAQATRVTIYLPGHDNGAAPLESACSLVSSGRLQSSQNEYLLERLYSGKGGVPVDVGAAPLHADSPPSYDELGPTPPPPSRRRRHSSPSSAGPSKKTRPNHPPDPEKRAQALDKGSSADADPFAWKHALEKQLEALVGEVAAVRKGGGTEGRAAAQSGDATATDERLRRVEEQMQELRDQMRQVEKTLRETAADRERELEERLERRLEQRLEERFGETWGKASKELEERLEEWLEEQLDERLDVAMQDSVDEADMRIEERALEIKDEMQTFVRDELQLVKEELIDGFELGRAVFRVDFER